MHWLRADVGARGKWCRHTERREQERGHHVDQPCKLCKLHDSARAQSFSLSPCYLSLSRTPHRRWRACDFQFGRAHRSGRLSCEG